MITLFTALALLFSAPQQKSIEFTQTADGGLSFDGGIIKIQTYLKGWDVADAHPDWKNAGKENRFLIGKGGNNYFRGESHWSRLKDGTVRGDIELTCTKDVTTQSISLSALLQFSTAEGREWSNGKASFRLDPDSKNNRYKSDRSQALHFPIGYDKTLKMSFDSPMKYKVQDSRRWKDELTVRFGEMQDEHSFKTGDRLKFHIILSSPQGISFKENKQGAGIKCVIDISDSWVPLDYKKDIIPGSALDFSSFGFQDAPAGKYGWLKAVDGHFEFERLPGKEQRFYGMNLCFTANYLTHEKADLLVERLAMMGYNTIRIHHHDGAWEQGDNADRLDYLIAAAIRKGLYLTTDLYVSRSIKWTDIGIDRKGTMDKNLFKAYVSCHDGAFENWCDFAGKFLNHVNPYTGRALKDEPAMALISFINEGKLGMHWTDVKMEDPVIKEAWIRFAGQKPLPKLGTDAFNEFDSYLNRTVFEKCRDFVQSLGCKALLTNDNNGSRHKDMEGETVLYDYVDNHFYVDHPRFLVRSWALPIYCKNTNPVFGGGPSLLTKRYAKGYAKPYTITEWNFSGPGRYRGMGGIMTGAMAAIQEWDGLWRFSYGHKAESIDYNPTLGPAYFDCSTDPLTMASDKSTVLLFLRRDMAEERGLVMDSKTGDMLLTTERTCGIFTTGGEKEAGILRANVTGVPATVCASSLDGKAIKASDKILVSHLTDIQGRGTEYADMTRTILLKWGKGTLIEAGSARISLALDAPSTYVVYELDTAGNRIRTMKSSTKKGRLEFNASTNGPSGGRMFYEITRLPKYSRF